MKTNDLDRIQTTIRVAMGILKKRLEEHNHLTDDIRATWRDDEYAMRDTYYILEQGLIKK